MARQAGEPQSAPALLSRAAETAADWDRMSELRQRVILLAVVRRVDLGPDQVIIHLRPRRLIELLDDRPSTASTALVDDEIALPLSQPAQLRRAGKEIRLVIDPSDPGAPLPKPDPTLVKTIVKAHRFNEALLRGGIGKFADLARSEKLHRSYYSQVLRLAYLAPDITAAILEGRQPPGLTATMLIEYSHLPLSWREQRAVLGFA